MVPDTYPILTDTDFGFTTFVGGPGLLGGGDCDVNNGRMKYMFVLADGVTIKNAILDTPGMGTYCRGTCTLENIFYKRLCYHAAGFGYEDINQVNTYTVIGGGGIGSPDKYFTQSGQGETQISGFCGDGAFGKLYCSCGDCHEQVTRHVTVSNVRMRGHGLTIVCMFFLTKYVHSAALQQQAVNKKYGDTASLSGIQLYQDSQDTMVEYICQIYSGKSDRHPEEEYMPNQDGQGQCSYSTSQVTLWTADGRPYQNTVGGQPVNQYPPKKKTSFNDIFGIGPSSRLPRPLSSTFYVCLLISLFVPQIPDTLMLHHNEQIVEIDSKYLSYDPITNHMPAEDDEEEDEEDDEEEEEKQCGYYCKFTVRLEQQEGNKCVSRTLDFGEIGGARDKGKSGPIDSRKNSAKNSTDRLNSDKNGNDQRKDKCKSGPIDKRKDFAKKRITDQKDSSKDGPTDQRKDSAKNGPIDSRKDSAKNNTNWLNDNTKKRITDQRKDNVKATH
ncbi:hypothetical protein niasHT_024884 [Heterodera trifolii]|uniref:Probable pectate lyase F n=1 Tax=Heterodera trifolii TaxID=157864 RepID=A0ABD2JZ81_9BILA